MISRTLLGILAIASCLPTLLATQVPAQSEDPKEAVTLIVRLPAQARLEIEDYATRQDGPVRRFISPALKPGKEYVYQLRARWMEGTREVLRTREVTVQAGQVIEVNFHEMDAPAPQEEPFKLLEIKPLSLVQGNSGTANIGIQRNDFWKAVQLTFPKVPDSFQIVDKATIFYWADSAEVTVKVSESAPVGKVLVPFQAQGGKITLQGNLPVIVRPIPPELTLEAPMFLRLLAGEKTLAKVRITRKAFQGKVQVRFSDLPPGVKISDLTLPAESNEGAAQVLADPNAPGTNTKVQVLAEGSGVRARDFFRLTISCRPSLVDSFLFRGQLAQGEKVLSARLKEQPRNDELRFGLGVLRFIRGVERMGQSFYQYGLKSQNTTLPFLRLPVPVNHQPKPIRNEDFRRILDTFQADLSEVEATLAQVTDDQVKLPIRLGLIHLDLDKDGQATDNFSNILKKIFGGALPFLEQNPDFLVCFDRGDVSWLRAYCHLLMGMLDLILAFDTQEYFAQYAGHVFPMPRESFPAKAWVKKRIVREEGPGLAVLEPHRLGRFRKHLIEVADLNHQTWKHILAETDDDHEWLPNPRQNAVIGLRVREEMITAWLAAVDEVKALLNGQIPFPQFWQNRIEKGINLKKLLDEPPAGLNFDTLLSEGLPEKYLMNGNPASLESVRRVLSIFDNPMALAYAAWFN